MANPINQDDPNLKMLTKPYALSRVAWAMQYINKHRQLKIKNSNFSIIDCGDFASNNTLRLLYPEMYAAKEELRLNIARIAAGAAANPPVVVEPIAVSPYLPKERPTWAPQPANPTTVNFSSWRVNSEKFESSEELYQSLKYDLKSGLPSEVFNTIETNAGIQGWAAVTVSQILDHVLDDEFAKTTPEEIQSVVNKIEKKWVYDLPLRASTESMVKANNDLGAALPHLKYDDQKLLRVAYSIAQMPDFDLTPIVNLFMAQPGQSYTTSTLTVFTDFLVEHSATYIHNPDSNRKAFACEGRYMAKPHGGHKLALEALSTTTDDDDNTAATGLALINPKWTDANWAEYQKLKKAKAPATGTPAATKLGKICFVCGWQGDHNSKKCPTMLSAPAGTYTPAQVSLTKFSPSKHPHLIDGKAINQTCAPGFHGWP